MKQPKTEVKCPICKEWSTIADVAIGMPMYCPNCRQSSVGVPRSSQARQMRKIVIAIIIIGGLILFSILYEWRFNELVETHGGFSLP